MIISTWRDLEKYGINPLTGEACAYSLRILCDVNQSGKELLERYFGNTITINPGSNWNSEVNKEPAIGSVMLPHEFLKPLATFILFHIEHCFAIIDQAGSGLYGVSEADLAQYLEYMPNGLNFRRNYQYQSDPSVVQGDRNIHQMSGKVD